MKIGVDFDNTIVAYDHAFYEIALEKKLITQNFPINKIIIRDYLRDNGKESDWTLLQGEVYGARMAEATPYPGAIEFMKSAQIVGHSIFIVSHKTRNPFSGTAYDLHAAAIEWIESKLLTKGVLLGNNQIYFEETKEKKASRAASIGCDVFIDDLPEILSMPSFNKIPQLILFDPENQHTSIQSNLVKVSSWFSIEKLLL